MYSDRLRGITRLHFIFQQGGVLAIFWIVYLLVNWLRFDGSLDSRAYVESTVILVAASLMEYFTRDRGTRSLAGLSRQQLAAVSYRQTLFASASIFGAMVMLKEDTISRTVLAIFFVGYFLWITWSNRCGHRWLHRQLYRSPAKGRAGALLVGSPRAVRRFYSAPQRPQPPGTDILGFVPVGTDGASGAVIPTELPLLGVFDDLKTICEESKAKALLLLGLNERRDLISPVTQLSQELGMRAVWIDEMDERYGAGSDRFYTGEHSVISPMREPLEDPMNRVFKRAFDLFGSVVGVILVLPPLMLFVAILHRLFSPGPLFYWQERTGRGGEIFRMLKFRSMKVTDPGESFLPASENDPRIFCGGDLLRRFSLDELPQLINVIRGEMSLVGPRPHPPALDDSLATRCRNYRLRHLAKPGMTGLAQSRGWRGETRTSQQARNRVRLDLFYLRHWSIWLDLSVIAETVKQLIKPPRSAF